MPQEPVPQSTSGFIKIISLKVKDAAWGIKGDTVTFTDLDLHAGYSWDSNTIMS